MRKTLPLAAAALLAAACNLKENRVGVVALSGPDPIPLVDESGRPAALVAGPAEVRFRSGSEADSVAISIHQDGLPEIRFTGRVSSRHRDGNFVMRGDEIGQPVSLFSRRATTLVDGPARVERRRTREFNRDCWIDVTFKPCDDSWTVDFRPAASDATLLGTFSSVKREQCEVSRGLPYACMPDPVPPPPIPTPRPRASALLSRLGEAGPDGLKFD